MEKCTGNDVLALILDTDKDGRLTVDEYLAAVSEALKGAALNTLQKRSFTVEAASEDQKLMTRLSTNSGVKASTDIFRKNLIEFFPNGIDALTPTDIETISSSSKNILRILAEHQNSTNSFDDIISGIMFKSYNRAVIDKYTAAQRECRSRK